MFWRKRQTIGWHKHPALHLETRRLALGPVSDADEYFINELHTDPEVRRFLGGPVPDVHLQARFRAYLIGAADVGIWIVGTRSNDTPVGLIVLGPHQDGADIEISYQFHPRHWGQGFALEAVGCVLDHGHNDLGLTRIVAETQTANTASRDLLKRLEMIEKQQLMRFGAQQIIYVSQR